MEIKIQTSKKARSIRISVHPGGDVVVTRPYFAPMFLVRKFINDKKDWIGKNVLKQKGKQSFRYSKTDYLNNKKRAFEIISDRVYFLNQFYGFDIKKISIRNQKTRWGSCSDKKTLSFNWRLINLSQELMDYVIVHEICHLKEMNHSKRFWGLVLETTPNYRILKKNLGKRSLSLL